MTCGRQHSGRQAEAGRINIHHKSPSYLLLSSPLTWVYSLKACFFSPSVFRAPYRPSVIIRRRAVSQVSSPWTSADASSSLKAARASS
jgi:hypothetical protein